MKNFANCLETFPPKSISISHTKLISYRKILAFDQAIYMFQNFVLNKCENFIWSHSFYRTFNRKYRKTFLNYIPFKITNYSLYLWLNFVIYFVGWNYGDGITLHEHLQNKLWSNAYLSYKHAESSWDCDNTKLYRPSDGESTNL